MMKMIYSALLVLFLSCAEKNQDDRVVEENTQEEQNEQDSTSSEDDNDEDTENDGTLTYLALGDSYTIGESVAETERWPVQLVEALTAAGLTVEDPRIIARTGWTTDELQGAINAAEISESYSMVSLLIGVNNQYRGFNIAKYRTEFEELLVQSIGFAGEDHEKVFVLSIPDYGVTPFGQTRNPDRIAEELDEYNVIAKSICDEYEVQFFNITPISRQAANDLDLIANDGLHPSGKMYGEWVDLIFPQVKDILN